MNTTVSFPLGQEEVTLPAIPVTFEADGLADHRVMIGSLWTVPIYNAPPELARQARFAVDGRHEITHIELGLGGRVNPHDRMNYGVWRRSAVIMDAVFNTSNREEADGTNIVLGQWYSPQSNQADDTDP
jgi:hypothetical protein